MSDDFWSGKYDEQKVREYFSGMRTVLDDFPIISNYSIEIENLGAGNVGYSQYGLKRIVVNSTFLKQGSVYNKGDGKLSWHSAHETVHHVVSRIMERRALKGDYDNPFDFYADKDKGRFTSKGILANATKIANKQTNQKLSTKAYLEKISYYAPLSSYNKRSHREGVAEAVGKYIQGGKNNNDVFGKAVYDGIKDLYNKYM